MTFLSIACFQIILLAQQEGTGSGDGSRRSTAETLSAPKGSAWVASPWVWAAGGVVLVLLLVALLRKGEGDTTTAE